MLDKALFKQMQNLSKKKKDAGNERVSNARHIWAVVVAHLVEQSDSEVRGSKPAIGKVLCRTYINCQLY